ncbi:MAG TPA: hypothetical protein VGK79_16530 [Gaiellaceae bacterium]
MTETIEKALRERFQLQFEPLPGANQADVRERAARLRGATRTPAARKPRRGVLVALASVTVILAAAAAAVAGAFLIGDGSRPVAYAGVSAFSVLPPAENPPSRLIHIIEGSVRRLGGDSTKAEQTLRLLRSNLGTTQTDLYAYDIGPLATTDHRDVLCLAVWERSAVCQTATDSLFPDALVTVSPGGPGYVGLPDDAPPTVAGLVADDVRAVHVVEAGHDQALPIENNAFFAELSRAQGTQLAITVRLFYDDGSTTTWSYGH